MRPRRAFRGIVVSKYQSHVSITAWCTNTGAGSEVLGVENVPRDLDILKLKRPARSMDSVVDSEVESREPIGGLKFERGRSKVVSNQTMMSSMNILQSAPLVQANLKTGSTFTHRKSRAKSIILFLVLPPSESRCYPTTQKPTNRTSTKQKEEKRLAGTIAINRGEGHVTAQKPK